MISASASIRGRPATISTFSLEALGSQWAVWATALTSATAWSTSVVWAIPFGIHAGFVVQKVGWVNGATVGNGTVECGVYTEGGTLLGSASATTAGVSAQQAVAVASPFKLEPGRYYMAALASSSTDTYRGQVPSVGVSDIMGVRYAANVTGSLRASETFAQLTVAKLPNLFIAGHTIY